jgi:PAS domain S-box-containing protein
LPAPTASERLLADTRAMYQAAFMASPWAMGVFDRDLRCVDMNPVLAELVRRERDDMLGKSLDEVFRVGADRVARDLRLVFEQRDVIVERSRVERVDAGPDRHWLVNYVPVAFTPGGEPIAVAMSAVEITDQKTTEAQLRNLMRLGALLVTELDLDQLVQQLTDIAKDAVGAEFGAFFYNVLDDGGESFMLYALSGAEPEAFEDFGMPRITPMFAPTFAGEAIVRIGDVLRDDRYGRVAPHHGMPQGHLPVRSYLAAPVKSRSGEVLGGLFFGHTRPDVFTDVAEATLAGITLHAGIAMENARLYGVEALAHQRFELLAAIGRLLSRTLEVDELLQSLVRELVPMLADHCEVSLLNDDGSVDRLFELSAPDATRQEFTRHAIALDGDHLIARVMRRQQGRVLTDVPRDVLEAAAEDDRHLAAIHELGLRSVIITPLVAHGRTVGALSLAVGPSGRSYAPDDLSFANEIADRAAMALDNARLYREQREAAEILQQALVPDIQPMPGLDIAARYRQARSTVGGDWFDVVPLPDGWAVVVGDVVGHGLPAATLMAQYRNALRAYLLQGDRPATAIAKLHQLSDLLADPFATVLVGRLGRRGELHLATAGHFPPLVLRDGIAAPAAMGAELPLGGMAAVPHEVTMRIAPGDTLVLFTDGLVERRGESIDVGLEELRVAVEGAAGLDTGAMADALLDAMTRRGPFHDDIALLVVRLR